MAHITTCGWTRTRREKSSSLLHKYRRGMGRFNRAKLPEALTFYSEELATLNGTGAWRNAVCCFHHDTNPSLSVNTETGGFICFACGASGGDVLSFVMQRRGLRFEEACKALGAWEISQ